MGVVMVGPKPPMSKRKGPGGTGKIDWNVEWPRAFGHLLAIKKTVFLAYFVWRMMSNKNDQRATIVS